MKKGNYLMIVITVVILLIFSACSGGVIPPEPLRAPRNPSPVDGAIGVALDVTLDWDGNNPTKTGLTYNVYLSQTSGQLTKVAENLQVTEYSPVGLQYAKKYYWRVEVKDAQGNTSRENALSSEWEFTTMADPYTPPPAPENPSPIDGETNVSTNVTLSWEQTNPDGRDLYYDVYFGQVGGTHDKIADGITATEVEKSGLAYNTTYQWRVDVYDTHESASRTPGAYNGSKKSLSRAPLQSLVTGDVWEFTTMEEPLEPLVPPENPTPADGETDVATRLTLSWEQSNPDGRDLYYNVYFGQTSGALDKVAEDLTVTELEQSGLAYNTTCYWRIEVYDGQGDSLLSPRDTVTGDEWEFTTMEEPYIPPQAPTNPTPEDGQTDVATQVTLMWEQSNPDGRDLYYDVYFGDTSGDLDKIAEDLTVTELEQSGLEYNTTYYWRVEVSDGQENTSRTAEVYTGSKKTKTLSLEFPKGNVHGTSPQKEYGVFPEGKTRQGDSLSPRVVISSEEWEFTTIAEPFTYDIFINGVSAFPIDTVKYAMTFNHLGDNVNRLVLTGNGADREIEVVGNSAEITDYLVEMGAQTATLNAYNSEELLWQKQILLPQPLELVDVNPEEPTALWSAYVISLKVNFTGISEITDFINLDAGRFLSFRNMENEVIETVPVEFSGESTTTSCTFKIFVEDETTTSGTLETDTAAYLEIDLK